MTDETILYQCIGCLHLYETNKVSCDCMENPNKIFCTFVAVPKSEFTKLQNQKPLTQAEIDDAHNIYYADSTSDFEAGVRFAERHHGITE